jgi:cell division inhibitor SepF
MVFNRLKSMIGFSEPEEYEEYYDEDEAQEEEYQPLYQEAPAPVVEEDRPNRRRMRERSNVTPSEIGMNQTTRNNVIGMPGVGSPIAEVVVIEPRSFEEMPQVIQALRERRSIVLNLTMMDPDEAQRAVDFVAGGTYAIDGHQERIGESIFLFTPSCVQVSTQSGVVHEVPSAPKVASRPNAPAPAWATESERMAQ